MTLNKYFIAAAFVLFLAFPGSGKAATYVWTGADDDQLNNTNNWLVSGVKPDTAPTDNGNQPKTPAIGDVLIFDNQDASWIQGPTILYSFTGTRPWGSIECRNGTITFKGDNNSYRNRSWSGTETMIVGDGDTNVLATLNGGLRELNAASAGGSSGDTKTYVVNADGTLNHGQGTYVYWSGSSTNGSATLDTVVRIIGGSVVLDGEFFEAPVTGDNGDYVSFEAFGSTLRFDKGTIGISFGQISDIEAQFGDSFRLGGALASSPTAELVVADNGATFTITAQYTPLAGTLFVFE